MPADPGRFLARTPNDGIHAGVKVPLAAVAGTSVRTALPIEPVPFAASNAGTVMHLTHGLGVVAVAGMVVSVTVPLAAAVAAVQTWKLYACDPLAPGLQAAGTVYVNVVVAAVTGKVGLAPPVLQLA